MPKLPVPRVQELICLLAKNFALDRYVTLRNQNGPMISST